MARPSHAVITLNDSGGVSSTVKLMETLALILPPRRHTMLTCQQKRQFSETGYLVVEGVLKNDLLATIHHEACLLGDADSTREAWNERACFRRRAFRQLLHIPELIDAARELLCDDLQLLALDLRVRAPWTRKCGLASRR